MENHYRFSKDMMVALSIIQRDVLAGRSQFATPEHFLKAALQLPVLEMTLDYWGVEYSDLEEDLQTWLDGLERVPDDIDYSPQFSVQMMTIIEVAQEYVKASGAQTIDITHCINALFNLKDSYAASLLTEAIEGDTAEFMSLLVTNSENPSAADNNQADNSGESHDGTRHQKETKEEWRDLVVCLNDVADSRNPLIGREKELQRTIQVLCRKDKNNPLHVGEPGVGKTALVYGLARMINRGDVPERLRETRIFSLDIATMLAGTKYRGDFEKRLKSILEGIRREPAPVVYIDEIHNIVGAGATEGGSMDASNLLKPYLESGEIRFIGSTTYEEFNRYFSKSKGLVRRFQQIDIVEPTTAETLEIIRRLKEIYEDFHNVTYTDEALEYAVEGSARHITERFLPDKAIDLVDEAGAYREMHPAGSGEPNLVDKALMTRILSGMCRVDLPDLEKKDRSDLKTLRERILTKVFGQDEAVRSVSEAVLMSQAGLTEENKPVASLLFVGPTGVGKTEVARVLAEEMGVPLLRFDMSEYAEKHSVAKLIGSPAGYVGYEDGGILTDAVRKSPSCVLLLDEIEKAHPDIFDILLQVMDYARLTDNKGRHTDFRNVVLIMTSNAGAQFASRANVGFKSRVTAGDAMLAQVKRTFKPEFLNRLSATVVFSGMTEDMASLILDKKLAALRAQLGKRQVTMEISPALRAHILDKGFSRDYGARELDRVVARDIKPLLMRAILFGSLKHGGTARLDFTDGSVVLLP